jgi:predicted methyltransferase
VGHPTGRFLALRPAAGDKTDLPRSDSDRKRELSDHPAELLRFAGIKPGMRVVSPVCWRAAVVTAKY